MEIDDKKEKLIMPQSKMAEIFTFFSEYH